MKKALLSILALGATTFCSMASLVNVDFTGSENLFGLTRYSFSRTMTYTLGNFQNVVNDLTITEGPIQFDFKKLDANGGFSLIDQTDSNFNKGLAMIGSAMAAKKTKPEITISIPEGTITKVVFDISGPAGPTSASDKDFQINGEKISTSAQNDVCTLVYNNSAGVQNVVLEGYVDGETGNIVALSATYIIRSIEVTYSADLGGKEESGLAFSEDSAEAIIGQPFTEPQLANEHNLPIVWTSSNENVATVDAEGNVTAMGIGNTVIKATTEGNDAYAAGDVQYKLTVIGSADNIPEMYTDAPTRSARVYVNFPMTVTYAAGYNAFVIDAEGNATEIHNTVYDGETSSKGTIYKVGNVIPAGWVAGNGFEIGTNWFGLPAYQNLETVAVTYPEVESINYAKDAYRVVVLKNVTWTTSTDATDKTYGTTPDGQPYEFQNTFNAANMPAGTYDVTVVVNCMTRGTTTYTWLAPIAYAEAQVEEDPVFPTELVFTVNSDLNATQGDEDGVYTINVSGETAEDNVVIKLEVPEGWDGFIGMTDADYNPDFGGFKKKAYASEWTSLEDMEQFGFKKVNELTFPADGEEHMGSLYLYKGDQVDEANQISVNVNVAKSAVEVDPEFPETFNVIVPTTDASLTVTQGVEQEVYTISISGECKTETVTITLEIPAGWDGFIGMTDSDYEPEIEIFKMKANAPEWAPVDAMLQYGMKKGNALTFDADGEDHMGQFYLYKGDMVDTANQIAFEINVKKSALTGVEAIEAEADARYFNLQGAEVINPEAGVYVKVVNGKATKVVVK